MTMEKIPDLAFEIDGDSINLEQDAGCGDVDRVTLHRIQLLHLAQRMGLVQEMSASEADNLRTPGEMARELDSMKRNLLRVRAHALELQSDFRNHADWRHADLTDEMWQINGLVDLLDMACDGFEDDYGPVSTVDTKEANEVITVITPTAEKRADVPNQQQATLI